MEENNTDLSGTSVGHIRLVQVIGKGGMGTVYEGVDETLQRRVAVKVIRGDQRLNPRSKARFLREGRILSQMDHHNICSVYDYIEGEEDDFLVLEMIRGKNLWQSMRAGLSSGQKLKIAEQLLEILVAVHSSGVIHRDLKPGNIMVRPDGNIVILDFGLARSSEEDPSTMPGGAVSTSAELEAPPDEALSAVELGPSFQVRTRHGIVIGTAGYLSPEQARAEPATAASDMYSAGLILQELFTGRPPFDEGTKPQRMILKAALGESNPVTGVATDLKKLVERLKALAPGARPSSVDALAELRRIIDAPKRRRRRIVVAAVWVALTILAGGMTIQSIRAFREAERANRETEAVREVSDFLVNLFEEANPERTRGASLSAEEILNRGAERIDEELVDQPLTRARLLLTIALVYNKMGLYSRAVEFADQSFEIRNRELGEESSEALRSLALRGTYRSSAGDLEGAAADLERAVHLREGSSGPDSIAVANALMNLATVQTYTGDYAASEVSLQRALSIYETELGPDHVTVAKTLANLGIRAAMQGHPEEAGQRFERALAILESELGADHPNVLRIRTNLASTLLERERYDEAEPLFRLNAEIQERVLGADHPDLGKAYQNYANLLVQLDRKEEAEQYYLRSLEISRAALGPTHPEVGLGLSNLGELYLIEGRLPEAEELCLEALPILEGALGPDHLWVGSTALHLARIARELGQNDLAERRYERCVAVYREALSPDDPQTVEAALELEELRSAHQ